MKVAKLQANIEALIAGKSVMTPAGSSVPPGFSSNVSPIPAGLGMATTIIYTTDFIGTKKMQKLSGFWIENDGGKKKENSWDLEKRFEHRLQCCRGL